MKPIIKTLTTIAAIGMSLYAVHCLTRLFPIARECTRRLFPTASVYDDAYWGMWFGLLTAISILTIVVLNKQGKESVAPSKKFAFTTYISTILMAGTLIIACMRTHYETYMIPTLYVRGSERMILALSISIWLWMMTYQSGTGKLSKPLRIAGIIGVVCLSIPLIRMMASAIYYFATGYLLYYDSWAIASWTQITIPTILMCWYSMEIGISQCKNHPNH